jgi:putative membrane protein
MRLLVHWIINGLVLMALPYVFTTIHVRSFPAALGGALIIGLLNALIRPILLILTLPINVLTLGLFTFVINGLLFWLATSLIPGLSVDGFWSAVLGAIVYSLISWALSHLLLPRPQIHPEGRR